MKDQKVRFAVVGCGRISQEHINAIKFSPLAELVAVCDINEEAGRAAAERNGLGKWYGSLEEMLLRDDIDVVNICTPSGLHCENTVTAARAGKHVLCEKPLDVTKEKTSLMIKECKDAGVKLGGIFQRRTNQAVIRAREAVGEGKLGNVVIGSAYLKYFRNQEYYDSDEWRGTWRLDGGGALMNQGIHGVDLLQWMVGGIESVYARCVTLARNIEVEDTAVATVKFTNGALGIIEAATSIYPGQDTVFSIHGDKGTISLGDNGIYAWDMMNSNENAPEIKDSFGGKNCGWSETNSGHIMQIQDMAEAVLFNRQPMVTGEEAAKAVNIVLAIYESSRTGKEIMID